MRPQLVDYKSFKINKPNITITKKVIFEKRVDYTNILFNIFIGIMISTGIYTLYMRWVNKEQNKQKYEQDVLKLNRKVNLN
tara:strand:- start:843 stop:1085 length:243 start_codon:yes stop_codon:yes gene_type:complete